MNDQNTVAPLDRLEDRIGTFETANQCLREANAELRDQIGTELLRHSGGADE